MFAGGENALIQSRLEVDWPCHEYKSGSGLMQSINPRMQLSDVDRSYGRDSNLQRIVSKRGRTALRRH
jgi:hypothetical protein